MKLIIELGEKRFKDIQRIASIQIKRRSLTCEQIIANGTPLEEELEKIRTEILSEYPQAESDKARLIGYCIHIALEFIDKHIAELKGE